MIINIIKMKKGFTIIELLVALGIIGLLVTIILAAFNSPGIRQKASLAKVMEFSQTAQNIIGDDLIAAWPFETVKDNKTPDMSGYSNEATVFGASQVEGLRIAAEAGTGQALSFNGTSNYITTPFSSFGGAMTFSVWVLRNNNATNDAILGSQGAGGLLLRAKAGNSADFDFYPNFGQPATALSGGQVGQWFFITLVFDDLSDAVKFYVNGALANSVSSTVGWGSGALMIGADNQTAGNTDFFGGKIDEVRVYSRALIIGEIQKQYAEGVETHKILAEK